jgi:hypothetical protein
VAVTATFNSAGPHLFLRQFLLDVLLNGPDLGDIVARTDDEIIGDGADVLKAENENISCFLVDCRPCRSDGFISAV